MANEIFIDTSGFFAIFHARDERHADAVRILAMAANRQRKFLTSDYVVVETANLLKARNLSHKLTNFFAGFNDSKVCRICWTDQNQFSFVQEYALKHNDQDWSFTDCHSFWLMKQLKLREALTKDHHFSQAGFKALLE